MFDDVRLFRAEALLQSCRARGVRLAAAESCTGGLIAALLTEIPGSSAVFDRGFVVYSNAAKADLLGVPEDILARYGAVSEPTAKAMAEGARRRSLADVAVAVTGIAGPGGGSAEKPIGLVYLACATAAGVSAVERRFGDIGRSAVRAATLDEALRLYEVALGSGVTT